MKWILGALKIFPLIIAAVNAVERLSSKKGTDKQDEAITLIGDLVPLIEASIGRDIVNEAEVQSAIRKVIDAVVALQNIVRDVVARHAAMAGR